MSGGRRGDAWQRSHHSRGGDIGKPEILVSLSALAPVTAVRCNVDRASWAHALPERVTISLGALRIDVIHDLADWADDAPYDVVVSGHSHRPLIRREGAILFRNWRRSVANSAVSISIQNAARGRLLQSIWSDHSGYKCGLRAATAVWQPNCPGVARPAGWQTQGWSECGL